jgi:Amt family ammonium transporter
VWLQIVGALFIIGWNIVWTSLIMIFIKYVLRIPLRMSDAACKIGDYAVHREESYTFAYFNRALIAENMGDKAGGDLEGGIHGIIMGRPLPQEPRHTGEHSRPSREAVDKIAPTEPVVESKKEA